MPQWQSLHNGDQNPHHNLQTHNRVRAFVRVPESALLLEPGCDRYGALRKDVMPARAHERLAHLHMPGPSTAASALGAACNLQREKSVTRTLQLDVNE